MLPECNEWQRMQNQLINISEEHEEYRNPSPGSTPKKRNNNDDRNRSLLANFDRQAHIDLVAALHAEKQYETCRVIQWFLDEHDRLFPLIS